MSWVAASVGASVAGGLITRQSGLSNAQAQADARNKSVQKNLDLLNGFGDANEGVFGKNISTYNPETQGTQLASATAARTAASAPTALNASSVPIDATASPAVRSEIAKRMLVAHDSAVTRSKASGRLGGYGDAWAVNNLRNTQANRDIGVNNNYAAGRKALIQPESDLAAAAAYKPPSIWGQILSGLGSVGAAYAGANAGAGAGGSPPPIPAGGGEGGGWLT